ncbi:phospholipase D-like domain-containing protein [Thioalkalicoccus limnaeus]|uniref:Phospholipase D-like domain-containing protein n=1 Tax=Thioalkalicoccus limnaeus TaxID=120681 RepID=A0ABV4BA40_9GAMM
MSISYETVVALVFHAVLAPATAIHALLYKRDPRASFGWIAVCVLFPLAGPALYLVFGLNRARGRAQRVGPRGLRVGFERGAVILDKEPLPDWIRTEHGRLARIGQALSRHALAPANRVDPLRNGEQAYPAMLEAIAGANGQILLTTYILDNDDTGRMFREALAKATQRGVDVRVIIDGFGDWYSLPRTSYILRRDGIQVARFLPPRLLPPSLSLNMRNHHKILIIDNQIAFTGGMNIGDRHLVDKPGNRQPTADIHFRVTGPVVAQLHREFRRMWHFTTGTHLAPPRHSPALAGTLACRTLTDGPDEDLDRLTMLLVAAIAEAKRSLRIMTPYFLPPREIVGALQAAAIRGVTVRIVLPERNNLPFVHWATRNMLWEVLLHGAQVFYQPPPFNHAKLFVVDDGYALIGSTNWDPRSLRLNFELQVEVYGEDFAHPLIEHMDRAAAAGRAVTLDEVDGRSLPTRLRDAVCWLFSPYL